MLTIMTTNGRQTDYSRAQLQTEARYLAKHAPQSDGKLRAWSILVIEHGNVALRANYLTTDGQALSAHTAL